MRVWREHAETVALAECVRFFLKIPGRVVLSELEELRRPSEDHRLPAGVEPVQVTRVGHAPQDGSDGGGHAGDLSRFNKLAQTAPPR